MEDKKVKIEKVYCDLDGVLVDFVKFAQSLVPEFKDEGAPDFNKKAEGWLWGRVGKRAKAGLEFWGKMDPLPDAMELWEYLQGLDVPVEILSATGVVGNPVAEKEKWVDDHLGDDVVVHLTKKAAEKAEFAAPNAVLIDDKLKAINPWKEKGGIGILHTSAEDTIRQLKELGL